MGLCVHFLSCALNTLRLIICYLQRGLLLKLGESVVFLDVCLIRWALGNLVQKTKKFYQESEL